jgi:hypothetical protein
MAFGKFPPSKKGTPNAPMTKGPNPGAKFQSGMGLSGSGASPKPNPFAKGTQPGPVPSVKTNTPPMKGPNTAGPPAPGMVPKGSMKPKGVKGY